MKLLSTLIGLSFIFNSASSMYQAETPQMNILRYKEEYKAFEEAKKLRDLVNQNSTTALESYLADNPKFDINGDILGGGSFLNWASFFNCSSVINFLVNNHSADLECKTELTKNTPLQIAAGMGNLDATRILISLNSDVGTRNRYTQMPIHTVIIAAGNNPDNFEDPEKIYLPIINALLEKDTDELQMVLADAAQTNAWLLAIQTNLPKIVAALSKKVAISQLETGLAIANTYTQRHPHCSQKSRDANALIIAFLENTIKSLPEN